MGFFFSAFLENKPITILQIMKLLHHSQGYSQMYILYIENRTSHVCVTVVRVDRALCDPCLSEGELFPVLYAESGLRHREAPSQPDCSIAIQTLEGTVMLRATAPHVGAIFSPEHFGPYLEDTGCTRERESDRRSQGHLVFTFTAHGNRDKMVFRLHFITGTQLANGSAENESICLTQLAVALGF